MAAVADLGEVGVSELLVRKNLLVFSVHGGVAATVGVCRPRYSTPAYRPLSVHRHVSPSGPR